jgi:hypothetical protein
LYSIFYKLLQANKNNSWITKYVKEHKLKAAELLSAKQVRFRTTGISTNTAADHVIDFIEDIGYGANGKKCFNIFGETQKHYMRV